MNLDKNKVVGCTCEAEGLVISAELQAYTNNMIMIVVPKAVNSESSRRY